MTELFSHEDLFSDSNTKITDINDIITFLSTFERVIPYLQCRKIFGKLLFQLNGGGSWRIRNVFPFCHGIGMRGSLPHLLLLHLTPCRIPVKPRLWNFKSQNQSWKEELAGVIQLSFRQRKVVTLSTAWQRIVEKPNFEVMLSRIHLQFAVLMQQVRKINLYIRMKEKTEPGCFILIAKLLWWEDSTKENKMEEKETSAR